MKKLHDLGFVKDENKDSAKTFWDLFWDFELVNYSTPSEYIKKYWDEYISKRTNTSLNWKVFELVLWTLMYREGLVPLYIWAKVAFVPNVNYDFMLYSKEFWPICISAKTSLRERYKQADLEAIALKYVHRKSKSFLLTMDEKEANSVKQKIKKWDVIGLDDVVLWDMKEFDELITYLKTLIFCEPWKIEIITAQGVVR